MKRTRARNPASRADVKPLRRAQLIEATMKTIARRGYAQTTMAHIAGAAGLSQGIVNFYFKSKEALLYETLVYLADEYETLSRRAIARAGPDPVAALDAIIETDLGEEVCNARKVPVWLSFWAECSGRPKYRSLCARLGTDYFRQVGDQCARLIEAGGHEGIDVGLVARGLNGMIDGFWVEFTVDRKSFDREQAKAACRAFLASFFPAEFGADYGADRSARAS